MTIRTWISLPTSDLDASKAFYTALGAEFTPEMSDDNGACFLWSETLYFMMMSREFLATFTDKAIADPKTAVQTQVAMTRDSREEVDAVIEKGLASGGSEPRPAQDYGSMYMRDLEDPDGNNLAFMWMDPTAADTAASVVEQAQA